LGSLDEPTSFTVFDVGCGADIILGYDWLKAHDLQFLYDERQISVCPVGDPSGRRVRADLVGPGGAQSDSAAAASLMHPREVRRMLSSLGLDASAPWSSPLLWRRPSVGAAGRAGLADDLHAMACLSSLASADLTLPDGTELFVGAFSLVQPDAPPPGPDHPAFEALVQEYDDVFNLPIGMPPDRGREFELVIDTGDAPMPRSRPLKRFSQGELDECKKQIEHLLAMGWIQPSRASHAASVVFARKKDGTFRFCQDFRGLNSITKKSCEPLPHIDQLLDECRGAKFFSKFDLQAAYHQLLIREEDRWKTSFRVPGGQYEFKVGAFGLHGMPSLLQRYMTSILARPALRFDHAGRPLPLDALAPPTPSMLGCFVAVYMDDLVVWSSSEEEHRRHVRMIFETLRHHKLYAKRAKCTFARSEVAFLGHILSVDGLKADPAKVEAVRDWAVPSSCVEVRRFVGLANYFRRYIDRFSEVAAPLSSLTGPAAVFRWGEREQRSFEALKQALCSAPVLRIWQPGLQTRLTTDASEVATSAVLEQLVGTDWHPVAFESRKLAESERHYTPACLELLAVVRAFKALRPWLLDSEFELHTDSKPVEWIHEKKSLSSLHARWLDVMAEFKYKVTHIPGKLNVADPFSRRYKAGPAPSLDRTAAAACFACAVLSDLPATAPRLLRTEFGADLQRAVFDDPILSDIAREAQDTADHTARRAGGCFVWRDGHLWRKAARGDRLCIPADATLRRLVLEELHATPLGGHFGRERTLALARRSVWWSSLPGDVAAFVRACPTCQRIKAEHGLPPGLTFPLPVPARRGGAISLDFMELPRSRSGRDFLQVHIDLLTGRVWLVPTVKTCTSEMAAANFVGSVFRDVGLPDCIVSDRDTRFVAEFWTSLHDCLGTRLVFGTPHHHKTTAKVERVNGVVGDALRAFVSDRQDNWDELIPLVEFALNDSASVLGCGYTPFFMDRGCHPRRPLAPPLVPTDSAGKLGEDLARLMDHVTGEVRALLQEAQDERRQLRDQGRRAVVFAVGDEVLLDTSFAPLPSRGILSARWMGPFKVLGPASAPNTYLLDLPATWRAHREFNVERLRRYVRAPDWMVANRPPPPRREVSHVLRFQVRRGHPSSPPPLCPP